tara:strand:+ start:104 stop:682 length:579 start_codon:yes stop_codon:yes gene_type:complete
MSNAGMIPAILNTTGDAISSAAPLVNSLGVILNNKIKQDDGENLTEPETVSEMVSKNTNNVKTGISSAFHNIIRDGSIKEKLARNKKFLIYFSTEKILTAISVILVICYTVFILTMHNKAKTVVEKQNVEFTHEVLWGSAGTDGTLYYISRLMFGFVIMMCAGKFLFSLIKTNTYIFDTEEQRDNAIKDKVE